MSDRQVADEAMAPVLDRATVTLSADDLPAVEAALNEARSAMATTTGNIRAIVKSVSYKPATDPEKQDTTTITLVVEGRAAVEAAGNVARFSARIVTVSMRGYAQQLRLWEDDPT